MDTSGRKHLPLQHRLRTDAAKYQRLLILHLTVYLANLISHGASQSLTPPFHPLGAHRGVNLISAETETTLGYAGLTRSLHFRTGR